MKKKNYSRKLSEGDKILGEKKSFNELFDELMSNQSLGMTKMQKRHNIEWLIKLARNSVEMWNVVKCAKKIAYPLTDKQNESIITKLIYFSSGVKLKKIENYAKSNNLHLHYVMEMTEKEIAKVFT